MTEKCLADCDEAIEDWRVRLEAASCAVRQRPLAAVDDDTDWDDTTEDVIRRQRPRARLRAPDPDIFRVQGLQGEVQVAHAAGFFGKIVYLRLGRLKVHWFDPLGKSTFNFLTFVLFYDGLFVFEVGVPVAPFALKSMWIFAEQIFLKRHCSTTKVLNFAKIDPSLIEVLIFSAGK